MSKDIEKVEVMGKTHGNGLWEPHTGSETLSLYDYFSKEKRLDEEAWANIQGEAANILSKCVPPTENEGSVTGLVVGYVQSGKTMSFTTVAAMARDNRYRIVIVISGTSIPLLNQGVGRLKEDLRISSRSDRKWQLFESPTIAEKRALESTLADWKYAQEDGFEPETVLITVMKHHSHLEHLIELLASMNLDGVPTLIIDDEADQASMNARVRKNGETSTYSKLIGLRKAIPHHSFLQYTATPQAPLLINIIDTLSPSFVEVLTPGKYYTGGKQFFIEKPELIEVIPDTQIASRENGLTDPPETLMQALRVFFLGSAIGFSEGASGNRSMLVHPSRETPGHEQFFGWIEGMVAEWADVMELDDSDPDKKELMADFEKSYEDLLQTISSPMKFEELSSHLRRALRKTQVVEVNARDGDTPQIDWKKFYSHVLVGGQAMDRGFTIEGLTVTYMPRNRGVGNADTIQQRARFFGYKLGYIGFCRVYLDAEVEHAFRSYVEHEEDMRRRLLELTASGKSLKEWKRAFFLDPSLRPTRQSVHDLDYKQGKFSDAWYDPKTPHDPIEAVEHNRVIVSEFISGLEFVEDEGDSRRTPEQRHAVAKGISLKEAFERLLTQVITASPDDSQKYTGLLLQIENYLEEHKDAVCDIYHMRRGASRKRRINGDNEIGELFQGRNDPTGYPGDNKIRGQGLSIQIHSLEITDETGSTVLVSKVPAIAVWVPSEMSITWVVQEEN
jgi:hypothetical protein